MPHQQQQQQEQQHCTNMISPSSLPSELIHGANNSNNCISVVDSPSSSSCSSNSTTSSAWQQKEEEQQVFLEDLKDVLTFMKKQESSYEKRATNNRLLRMKNQNQFLSNNSNNLSKSLHSNHLPPFYNSWRPVMISWMYHIADTFRLMPIVVATGIYILDTCAVDLELEFDLDLENTNNSNNSKQKYPLMTMTALNMAVKCHETKMFPLDQLVLLLGGNGGNRYTPDDICTMERYMLEKCEWKLHKPTTHDYILRYVSVLSSTPEQRDIILSKSILYLKYSLLWEHILHNQESNDSSGSDGTGTGFSSCVLAYAAFLLAMEDIDNTANTDTNTVALLLSFNEKQSACLCLLECGNLSASTPYLQQAYNWLLQSKSLQTQLEQKQQNKNHVAAKQQVPRSSFSQATAVPVPVPVPVEAVVVATPTVAAAGQASSQVVLSSTNQQQQQQYETTDTSNMDVDTDKNTPDLLLLSFDNDEKRISASKSTLSDDDTADTSIMTCSDTSATTTSSSSSSTYHEIIYCSYSSSSDGDAFEVVAASNLSDDNDYEDYDYDYDEYEQEDDDNEDDDMVVDDEDDHSMAFLPTVLEEEDHNLEGDNLLKVTTNTTYNNNVHVHVVENNNDDEIEEQEDNNNNNNCLVLTESLDEGGFEIAYGNNKHATSTSGNEQLRLRADANANNFITSPRDVSIAL